MTKTEKKPKKKAVRKIREIKKEPPPPPGRKTPYICIYIPATQQDRIDEMVASIVEKGELRSRSELIREIIWRCLLKLESVDPKSYGKKLSIKFHL